MPSPRDLNPTPPPLVILVDNRDSFTFNLAHGFAELGVDVDVLDGRTLDVNAVLERKPSLVCIGPGPRGPRDLPALVDFVAALDGTIPLLGVCLGMQALVLARGGNVGRAREPVHGERRAIEHDARGLFAELPSPLWVMRYHSLICDAIPPSLRVNATANGEAMACEDPATRSYAVQFHPESVGTAGGSVMLRNMLRAAFGDSGESTALPLRPTWGRVGAIPLVSENGRRTPPGALDGDRMKVLPPTGGGEIRVWSPFTAEKP